MTMTMTKWRYTVERFDDPGAFPDSLQSQLNKFGEQGWELVTLARQQSREGRIVKVSWLGVFKQPALWRGQTQPLLT